MEQSFWGKLKRVKLEDLLHIFKFLLALPIAFFIRKNEKDCGYFVIQRRRQEIMRTGYSAISESITENRMQCMPFI